MSKYNLMGGGLGGGTDYAIARRSVDLHSRMEESVERVYAVVSHVQIQLGEGSTDCAIARRIVDLHSRMEESVERVYAVVSDV